MPCIGKGNERKYRQEEAQLIVVRELLLVYKS